MIITDGVNHGKLQTIIVGELKKAGLKHRLKKIILKSVKDHKTVFGATLLKVPSSRVICCDSTLIIPKIVHEMVSVLKNNAHVEGIFRKAGSQCRQKDIKRLLDAGGCVSEGHHPIDVASVLKLYLRCLPEPLISVEVQELLLRCHLSSENNDITPILHTLLLLPVLHVHLLHFIMELLNYIASHQTQNLMDSSNLAIVMTPSIMPLPAASTAQRLQHHVSLVKIFIENSHSIGVLTDEMLMQLDEDRDNYAARTKKRRSGSLNRMLSGLRKMVSGSVNTPGTVKESGKTPVLSKSAAKRKFDSYAGLSAKAKKEIKKNLQQKELSFTPKKTGFGDRKRLRLSMMESRSTPIINVDFSNNKNSETSVSSEDLLTSSENLFCAHDTIDLSPDMKKRDKDYVRISKIEYEEIKSRVSAIENRLSREFTDVIPRVEPFQQVQNVYQQTLEDVANLHCPTSDHLARRLSKELKIRPNEHPKIIRSPSARKIGNIRRRSKENLTKIVRHKSWNVSSYSQAGHNIDRFYPYVGLNRREQTRTSKADSVATNCQNSLSDCDASISETSTNMSDSSLKYNLRKRISLAVDYNLDKSINKVHPRRSLNITADKTWSNLSENSNTLNSSEKSNISIDRPIYQNIPNRNLINNKKSPSKSQPKWRSAAAFFMDKTGEMDHSSQTGRPSVNKLRKQNAGAVLAKAKLFESSDNSSEKVDKSLNKGFARKPRSNGPPIKSQRMIAYVKPKVQTASNNAPSMCARSEETAPFALCKNYRSNKMDVDNNRLNRRSATPLKKSSPLNNVKTPQTPSMKKPLCPSRHLRTPNFGNESKRAQTPLKAVHVSPRRRSPRLKQHRQCN